MVTELFLEWSDEDPLAVELLRATAGTAGVTAGLPFTGDGEEATLAFCAEEAEAPPTTTGGLGTGRDYRRLRELLWRTCSGGIRSRRGRGGVGRRDGVLLIRRRRHKGEGVRDAKSW